MVTSVEKSIQNLKALENIQKSNPYGNGYFREETKEEQKRMVNGSKAEGNSLDIQGKVVMTTAVQRAS